MKLNIKQTVVRVTVALALSAAVPAQAGVMNIMDDQGGKLMVLGVAGVAVGFVPAVAFVGIGACMHWHCISAYDSPDHVPLNDIGHQSGPPGIFQDTRAINKR